MICYVVLMINRTVWNISELHLWMFNGPEGNQKHNCQENSNAIGWWSFCLSGPVWRWWLTRMRTKWKDCGRMRSTQIAFKYLCLWCSVWNQRDEEQNHEVSTLVSAKRSGIKHLLSIFLPSDKKSIGHFCFEHHLIPSCLEKDCSKK